MPIIADVAPSSGPTLSQLVTEIVTAAQGFSIAPDQFCTLKTDITELSTTILVEGTASPGVLEIGDELVYVTAVDTATGTCTVHPRGRGWLGTTATPHDAGDVVGVAPVMPRARAATLVNDVLSKLYPALFGVGTATGTVDGPMLEVPDECQAVLDVRTQDRDGNWQRVRHWESEFSSSAGSSGKVVRLPRSCDGDSVQVVYATRPEQFAAADQRWSATGMSPAVKDIVVTGVLAKFAKTLDLGRLTDRFTTPQGDNQQPQLGAGFAMSRQLDADFKAALDAEAGVLRNQYPARAHFVR